MKQNLLPTQILVIMGTSASGKSHIGHYLSKTLSLPFIDGDDLHSESNIQKMCSGLPLTDTDRFPWFRSILNTFLSLIKESSNPPKGIIIACSALKKSYRDFLREGISKDNSVKIWFVYLKTSKKVLEERIRRREGHFMKLGMLESQFKDLEEPSEKDEERIVVVNGNNQADEVVKEIIEKVREPLMKEEMICFS
ncbi:hypothetical protein G9A89_009845 [Geosiphon pyriformis]|nr:hypothetical protein G9A89_009845 [Geosiphon pyriformis]